MSQGTCHIKAAFPISLPGILLLLGISGVRAETEYLLLDMRADDLVIAESLLTLKTESTYLVGLDPFLAGLDFPIAQDQQEWSGWFRNETLRFRWDVRESQINYGVDQQHQLQPGQWLTNRDGTFVAVGVLEYIFGLTLVIDERNQAISLTSRVPLAFQTSRARAQARRRIQTRVKRKEIEGVTIADAYRWATLPMFDSTVNSSLTSRQGTRSSAHNANLSLTMDLLKHSIRYVGSRSYRSQESARGTQRMTVRRSARTREEDLFLGVRHLSFGDLFGTQNELVGGRGAGVGISLVGGSRRGDHDLSARRLPSKVIQSRAGRLSYSGMGFLLLLRPSMTAADSTSPSRSFRSAKTSSS